MNSKMYNVTKLLSDEERKSFNCDTRTIEWYPYLKNYIEGMAVWVLKEHKCSPEH